MPGFDNTGPEGKGSKTGRGLGTCNHNSTQEENKKDDLKRLSGGIRRRLRNCRRNGGGMRNRHRNSGANKK